MFIQVSDIGIKIEHPSPSSACLLDGKPLPRNPLLRVLGHPWNDGTMEPQTRQNWYSSKHEFLPPLF